ncbi:MAG TPA: LamG domain-containing protein [Polyangiaceae bacterium]|nr:LamG domain-containing protein [Polyangiaceae bacterium]
MQKKRRHATNITSQRSGALRTFALGLAALSAAACSAADQSGTAENEAGEAVGSSAEAIVTSGLVARYTFEGNASDSSGQGRNGTPSGTISYPSEHGGKALYLDGQGGVVTVADAASLRFTKFTACAWVKPEEGGGNSRIFEKGSDSSYRLFVRDGQAVLGLNTSGGFKEVASRKFVPPRAWTHLCATYDGATVGFYLNGVADLSQDSDALNDPDYAGWSAADKQAYQDAHSRSVPGPLINDTSALTIGSKPGGTAGDRFTGYVDDLRFYNRVLTAAEITTTYNDGTTTQRNLKITCANAGLVYVNGSDSGKTCAVGSTLSIPIKVPGHYWVGLADETNKRYQHKQIYFTGSADVTVAFTNSSWLASRPWKVRLLEVAKADLGNGRIASLSASDLTGGEASFKETATWIPQFTRGTGSWSYDIEKVTDVVGKMQLEDDPNSPNFNKYCKLDLSALLNQLNRGWLTSTYDAVLILFPMWPDDGSAQNVCSGQFTYTVGDGLSVIPNDWGRNQHWKEGSAQVNTQVFLHEWLHTAEYQYGGKMGWPQPLGVNYGIHASHRYGYNETSEFYLEWYRDYMAGKLQDGPVRGLVAPYRDQYVGMPPMAWFESSRLTKNRLPHTVP